MQVGDLVFVKSNSIVSKVVRLVSTGKVNQDVPHHVAVVTAIYSTAIVLTEAAWGSGVKTVPFSKYGKDTIWIMRMVEPRDIQKGLEFLHNQIGLGYDRTAIFGIFLRSFWRLLGPRVYNKIKRIRNFLDSKTKFFCSELVSYYGMETGKKLWNASPTETTPFDLWRSRLLFDV